MAVMGKIPVFMRVGDSEEYEIGSFSPEVTLASMPADGRIAEISASADIRKPLAALLREAADAAERMPDGD
jgi:hypothetical protein